jgi:hypothetical protein
MAVAFQAFQAFTRAQIGSSSIHIRRRDSHVMTAFVDHGVPMPTYEEVMAQHEASLAALRANNGVVFRSGTPAPSASSSTPPTPATARPTTAPITVVQPDAQLPPSTPSRADAVPPVHDVPMCTPSPARSASTSSSASIPSSTPPTKNVPLFAGEPDDDAPGQSPLPPPYSPCETPKQATSHMKLAALKKKARHLTIDTTMSSPSAPTAPRTPHTPTVSSPLARKPLYPDSEDEVGDALPTPHDRLKAYEHGRPSDIFGAIPGNSGVLASDGDIFSSDDLLVEARTQRVGVRLSSVFSTHLSGESLSMDGGANTASATGPSARVLTINTKGGLAASAYLNRGKAHLTIANFPSSSPANKSDVEPPLPKRTWMSRGSPPKGHAPDDDVGPVGPNIDRPAPRRAGALKSGGPSPSAPPPTKRAKVSKPAVSSDDEPASGGESSPPRRTSSSTTRVGPPRARASTAKARPSVGNARTVASASKRSMSNTIDPMAPNMLQVLGVTAASLSKTALACPASLILHHAPELGATFVRLLDHLGTLDADTTVCLAPAQGTTHYSMRTAHRPEAIAIFIRNARKFTKGVFKDFNVKNFSDDFWAWWNDIAKDVCYPHRPSKFARPGALLPTADFDSMLWRGPNGFGHVVAGLAIWIFGLKLQDTTTTKLRFDKTPSTADFKRWLEAVKSVEVVAAAMVDSLA